MFMQPDINFLINYLIIGLTQIIVAGVCLMFDISFGCMYLSLYSVGVMIIDFEGFDQYCDKSQKLLYTYFQTLKIIDGFLFLLFPIEA